MDFNAISIDPEAELDDSGVERVPMADPEMDVSVLRLVSNPGCRLIRPPSDHSPNRWELTNPPHQTVPRICTFAGEARYQVCLLWLSLTFECLSDGPSSGSQRLEGPPGTQEFRRYAHDAETLSWCALGGRGLRWYDPPALYLRCIAQSLLLLFFRPYM